jgi:hypothetical protein
MKEWDQQPRRPSPIPSQRRLMQHLSKHWPQFKVLRQRYAGTRFEDQEHKARSRNQPFACR